MSMEQDQQALQIGLDLSATSMETLALFMDETSDDDIFKEILNANKTRTDVIRLLFEHENTPDDVRAEAASVLSVPALTSTEVAVIKEKAEAKKKTEPEEAKKERILTRIQKMTVSEKIKLAQKGSSEARGILLRDSNKLVVMATLGNPRITESEIAGVARSRSVVEDALRHIAKSREWMKSYAVMKSLATNPKTPVQISVGLVPNLKKRDMQLLEKDKNVPEAVRALARKFNKAQKGSG